MGFDTGVASSGTGSLADDILRTDRIDRVDFIGMDIEGAKRETLKRAALFPYAVFHQ